MDTYPFENGVTAYPRCFILIGHNYNWTVLFLKAKSPLVTSQPTSLTEVSSRKAVVFSVQATGTEPLGYQWQWKQYGKEGEKAGWQNLSGEGCNFQVREVKTCNAGYYRCVVSNSAGSETSQCASLTVGKH